jgi:hypothetical protein
MAHERNPDKLDLHNQFVQFSMAFFVSVLAGLVIIAAFVH